MALAQVLIRKLDDQVLERLKARAQRRGLSLEQSLRELLTTASQDTDQRLAELAGLRTQPLRQGGTWMGPA
jgi:plasmid stability protein